MNKRAFTLLELLATIIILGLLTTIVIAGILPLLNRGNDEYYQSQEDMIILAAKDYFTDYRSKLPKEIGETSEVTLKELIEKKYIDPIKDRNNKDCNYEDSKVVVQKISDDEYQYYVTLICETDSYETEEDRTKPVITFSPNKQVSTNSIKVTMKVTDNIKVNKYRYVIKKDDENMTDTGYLDYSGDVEINLTDKGVYKIIGYAIDTSGNIRNRESGIYSIYQGIDCSQIEVDNSITTKKWTKEDIDVNIKLPSNTYRWELSKKVGNSDYVAVNSYIGNASTKITLNESGKTTLKLVLYDSTGNSCTYVTDEYYLDKTPPTCTSGGGSDSWTTGSRTITGTCSDSESGCKGNVSKFYNSEGNFANQSPGTVSDNVGNTTVCPANQNVRIDRTKPVYTSVYPGCGDPQGVGHKGYVKFFFSDTLSGLGVRTVHYWDAGNNVYYPDINYNGAPSGGDTLGTGGRWLGFEHRICDMAGNCSEWNDPNVGFSC